MLQRSLAPCTSVNRPRPHAPQDQDLYRSDPDMHILEGPQHLLDLKTGCIVRGVRTKRCGGHMASSVPFICFSAS